MHNELFFISKSKTKEKKLKRHFFVCNEFIKALRPRNLIDKKKTG